MEELLTLSVYTLEGCSVIWIHKREMTVLFGNMAIQIFSEEFSEDVFLM